MIVHQSRDRRRRMWLRHRVVTRGREAAAWRRRRRVGRPSRGRRTPGSSPSPTLATAGRNGPRRGIRSGV